MTNSQPSLLRNNNFYLVGIKGVAMAALAQCLVDAGKNVTGADLVEDFVTKDVLDKLNLNIDIDFDHNLPQETDCLIYTAAHQGPSNPLVLQAQQKKISCFAHAEALADLFNAKQGLAVCGVGGKSTTSAMISWVLEKSGHHPSYAVGVGNIPGLNRTGKWNQNSKYFVAEADEYVTDPAAIEKGVPITPRFSFLKPWVNICTNLKFDHPDVYSSFDHTKQVYLDFFNNTSDQGCLVINQDDQELVKLAKEADRKILSFGSSNQADLRLLEHKSQPGKTLGRFTYQNHEYTLELMQPGVFNLFNGLAAVAACSFLGLEIEQSLNSLKSFNSTIRRSQFMGEKNGVKHYDDYAHHPNEIKQIITAFKEWFPDQRLVVAFEPHTYSRTKSLFNEFVSALATNQDLAFIDIFPSAREKKDNSVSSDLLAQEVKKQKGVVSSENTHSVEGLAKYCQANLKSGDVFLTLGAGDIYKVHEMILA